MSFALQVTTLNLGMYDIHLNVFDALPSLKIISLK